MFSLQSRGLSRLSYSGFSLPPTTTQIVLWVRGINRDPRISEAGDSENCSMGVKYGCCTKAAQESKFPSFVSVRETLKPHIKVKNMVAGATIEYNNKHVYRVGIYGPFKIREICSLRQLIHSA